MGFWNLKVGEGGRERERERERIGPNKGAKMA